MSIGAGRLKGRRLAVAPGTRPSGSRLKEALFSIWSERLPGAAVLDLYAGSGGVGIEAWSRGAGVVCLVESGRRAIAALRGNLELLPSDAECRLLPLPAERAVSRLASEGRRFDLLFADPPYSAALTPEMLAALSGVAADGASLAVEHRTGGDPPAAPGRWRLVATRRYGDSALSFYESVPPDSAPSSSR